MPAAAAPSRCSSDSEEGGSPVERLTFKLVALGDAAVGKTALIKRLVQGTFETSYTPTAGVDLWSWQCTLVAPHDVQTTLQIWDIGSRMSSLSMAANYLHGCDAVLAVHDIGREETYSTVWQWLGLLQQMFAAGALPYIAVLAAKADSAAHAAAAAALPALTAASGRVCAYSTSALTGEGVVTAFRTIAADLAGIPLPLQPQDSGSDLGQAPGALQLRTLVSSPSPCRQRPASAGAKPQSSPELSLPASHSGLRSNRGVGAEAPGVGPAGHQASKSRGDASQSLGCLPCGRLRRGNPASGESCWCRLM